MREAQALAALAALAHETRLQIVRLLVPHGRDGLPAGQEPVVSVVKAVESP